MSNANDQLSASYRQTRRGDIDYAYYVDIGRRERSREIGLFFNRASQRFSDIPFSVYTTFVIVIIGGSLWLYAV